MKEIVNHRVYGAVNSPATPVYILHGIFGMLDNWHYHAQLLEKQGLTVVTFDARNHGRSFHHGTMDYITMANDVAQLMEFLGHSKIDLVGHSMGGKTSMVFAWQHPQLLNKLAIIDMAPKRYKPGHLSYFDAFQSIDLEKILSRAEADKAFLPFAPDQAVRQFLLKNLEVLPTGGYTTKFNLPALIENYDTIIGELELPENIFLGPVLAMYGETSGYIKPEDKKEMIGAFPSIKFEEIPAAGHWVHADQPQLFFDSLFRFLTR